MCPIRKAYFFQNAQRNFQRVIGLLKKKSNNPLSKELGNKNYL